MFWKNKSEKELEHLKKLLQAQLDVAKTREDLANAQINKSIDGIENIRLMYEDTLKKCLDTVQVQKKEILTLKEQLQNTLVLMDFYKENWEKELASKEQVQPEVTKDSSKQEVKKKIDN